MRFIFSLVLIIGFSIQSSYAVRIASVNYKIEGNKTLTEVLNKVEAIAMASINSKSKYLLLPELITFDLLPLVPETKDLPELLKAIAKKSDAYEKGLKNIAKKYNLNILGASTFISQGSSLVNRAYFFHDDGKMETQEKNYPTPWEKKYGVIETQQLQTFQTRDFNFVILICYDSEFPGISSKLVEMKPEVIFVPSQTDDNFGLERVRRTSQARAIEHMAYVVLTGAVGEVSAPWHAYVGRNFLFTPQNKYFPGKDRSGQPTQEISVFDVDISLLRKSRADSQQIYPARDESSKL